MRKLSCDYPEFCYITMYCTGHVIWFGELAYIAKEDYVINEAPDDSKLWKIFVRGL